MTTPIPLAVASLLAGFSLALVALSALRSLARQRVAERFTSAVGAGKPILRASGLAGTVANAAAAVGRRTSAWMPASWTARYEKWIGRAQLPAGHPLGTASSVWGTKFLAAITSAALGIVLLDAGTASLLAACGAFFLPDLALRERAEKRRAAFLRSLPDALDLLTLVVEAGAGFDAAIAKLVDRGQSGPLRDEITRYLQEIRMGQSRRDALTAAAKRVDLPEFSSFVTAVVQAEQMGASMGGTLRAQSAELRIRRTQAVEKKAQEAPIKMLFLLMVFVLPTVFLVLFGPIVLMFLKNG